MPRSRKPKASTEPPQIGAALAELPVAEEIAAEAPPPEREIIETPDRPPRRPYASKVKTGFERSFDIGGGERMHYRFFPQTRQFQIKFDGEQSRATKDHIEELGFHYIGRDRNGGEDQVWVKELHRWPSYEEREDFRRDCTELANRLRQERGFEPSISL